MQLRSHTLARLSLLATGLFLLLVTGSGWARAAGGGVVINEIIQNPAAVADSNGEWFELHNPTGAAIDIDGWTIQDNDFDSHVINNGGPLNVPAGGYLVLGRNGDMATNGGVTVDYVYSGITLANGADELVLIAGAAGDVDRVEWDGGPLFPDPTGASMSLQHPALDNNVGANWCEATTPFGDGDLGTPGAANDCPEPEVVINEIDYDQPSTDKDEFVEIRNNGPGGVSLSGYSLELVNGTGGGAAIYDTILLPGVTLAEGDYYVICGNAANVANCDLDVAPNTDLIQNGAPDAVALRDEGAALVDTVSYEGDTAAPYTEGSGAGLADDGANAGESISRCFNGVDTDQNNIDFVVKPITPGAANDCLDPITIMTVQGAAHKSLLEGQPVELVPSVVTVVTTSGFYLQDPTGDGDIATSDALFVFTGALPTVAVGDLVQVTGTVTEFYPGGFGSGNLATTEITSPVITPVSSGNPLPAPIVLGTGGRIPPNIVIDDDATGDVETSGTFDPATDGIDFYESLEGMRVQVNDAQVVGGNRFGEIGVVGDGGAHAGLLSTAGGVVVQPGDFNPERIIIDDALFATEPDVTVGDSFAAPIVGVIDYSFGNFKLLNPAALPAVVPGGTVSETTTLVGTATQLTVANMNVENLDPGDPASDFNALASIVVNNLQAPDVIALQEVQDNSGPTNDGVVDASTTYNTLIAAITGAGGPIYEFRDIAPVDGADGGQPGGNIRVGFLFRPDRVTFVDRPGGDATTPTAPVSDGSGGVRLTLSPGRVDPGNSAFSNSRKPLAGEFLFNGRTIIIIANHFNSKGGDDPLFGRVQPPVLSSEAQRIGQAQAVNDFVDATLAIAANADIIVVGDLNDFQFSPPLATLEGGVLTNLTNSLPASDRYTFIFDSNSQALDHMLVSTNLAAGPLESAAPEYDIVHTNSFVDTDFRPTDHDPLVGRFTLAVPTGVTLRVAAASGVMKSAWLWWTAAGMLSVTLFLWRRRPA